MDKYSSPSLSLAEKGAEKGAENSGVLDVPVAFYDSIHLKKPTGHFSFLELLDDIRAGKWEGSIQLIRGMREQEDECSDEIQSANFKKNRSLFKNNLPCFSMSCDAKSRESGIEIKDRGIQPTGILQLDIDHIDLEKIDQVRMQLQGHESIAFVFLSPSGDGLKAGLYIEGAGEPEQHKSAFSLAAQIVLELTGLEIDTATKDVQRLCFVSYDPDLYINLDPVKLYTKIQGVGQDVAESGLIQFNRHQTLLLEAISLRQNDGADADMIRKALEELGSRCTRQVKQSEIDGIVSWVMEKIDSDGPGFDVNDPQAWPDPLPLPDGLSPVISVKAEMCPQPVWNFAKDIAERMQCPVEYPLAAIYVLLGSVIGTQIGIRPKKEDDWTEVCNLWGYIVGNPGVMKSPSVKEAFRPLVDLEFQAKEKYEKEFLEYERTQESIKPKLKVKREEIEKLLGAGKDDEANKILEEIKDLEPSKPIRRRYIVNDPTIEKLFEILVENLNGQLWIRDELAGLFQNLERKGRESDRAFLLECWNGQGSYSTDRIGRGTVHVRNTIVSIFGTIQPEALVQYLLGQSKRGCVDDGFTQRFQIVFWPDIEEEWKDVDRKPDEEAREAIGALIDIFKDLDVDRIGAFTDGSIPYLRFSEEARSAYVKFRENLEKHLRFKKDGPAMELHLSKFRGLIPRLALINHLCEGKTGPVGVEELQKAFLFAECLESHARRIYAFADEGDLYAARRLGEKILSRVISGKFTSREVYRKNWRGLAKDDVEYAIDRLLAIHWIVAQKKSSSKGRPMVSYLVNPKLVSTEGSSLEPEQLDRSSGIYNVDE